MTSQTLRLSDGRAVRVLAEGQGAPVLLIHGVGLRAEAWSRQIAALSAGYRVIAADMPGHGESAPLPETASLPDFVAWTAGVIGALGLGPVSLAGHSMGALIAGALAVERPDLVARVALISPVFRRPAAARDAVLVRAAEIAAGKASPEAPLDRWFAPDEADLRAEAAEWLRGADRQGYATAYRSFAEGDAIYAGRYPEIGCPALVLTGALDGNSTPAMARAIAALMPRGRAEVVDGHRHMVTMTAPGEVNRALGQWLTEGETAR